MECRDITHTPPSRVAVDKPIAEATAQLVRHHPYHLPAVDREAIPAGGSSHPTPLRALEGAV